MCGLFGFARIGSNSLNDEEIAAGERALDTLIHRGPDQRGIKIQDSVFIGHTRLSILDLSELGRQPMHSTQTFVTISVNGEIYNYQELRRKIGQAQFRSDSDSEVLLHGYSKWGINKLVDELDGMYAAVIYDQRKKDIHMLRDRAGIKPLYYGRVADYFVWSSELKAIVAFLGEAQLSLDETALFDFLTYRYVPSPKSIYRQVRKLEPASTLKLNVATGNTSTSRYWRLATDEISISQDDASETINELLGASVSEQMMSDVPVGFFLSGGIDSSAIVGLATGHNETLRTFSIGFDVQEHDETKFADIVADQFKTEHFKKILTQSDSIDLLFWMWQMYDEPFADTSALATYHVSKFARERCVVALSGDGGDELFGGYNWYKRHQRWRTLQRILAPCARANFTIPFYRPPRNVVEKIRNRIALFAQFSPLQLYQSLFPGLTLFERQNYREQLEIPVDYDDLWHFRRYYVPDLGKFKSLQYIDFHTFLPDDILTKVDRVSMAVSLEVRVPFLSKKLIEFAFSLPETILYRGGELKGGLKHALQDMLPSEIINRDKKGFSVPTSRWQENVLAGFGTFQERMAHSMLDNTSLASVRRAPK